MKRATIRARVGAVVSTALATMGALLVGLLGPVGTAHADTAPFQARRVYVNLWGPPGIGLRDSYSYFLQSVRDAAGHAGPAEVMQTQHEGVGLVWVTLTARNEHNQERRIHLWMNPANMYILGFTTHDGRTYEFNDTGRVGSNDTTLRWRMRNTHGQEIQAAGISRDPIQLNFGGGYGSLENAAQRGRDRMQVGYFDVQASILQLATIANPSGVGRLESARSLTLMIHFVSEAARFHDIEGSFRTAMATYEQRPLPGWQVALENAWGALSAYWRRLLDPRVDDNPPFLPGVSNYYGLDNVRRYLSIANSST
ncbi:MULTISPECIES: ribosome-inactivating family protein [Streptomyces]|uniref:ribosome-inactivating family protein n=1 Tax=Streptomyces TaxID=1883 RepID=UPI00131DE547|nr:ribosome-inactivating family protein [Streptomyces sp. XY413]